MKKIPLLEILKKKYPDIMPERLYSYIMCGEVLVDGGRVRDPKILFQSDIPVFISEKKYVSRGGFKLEKALSQWKLDVSGKVMLDAGSSTGGFTDCLLQHGASLVHAVDSGFNQLSSRLRNDSRVISHEKTNIMELGSLDPVPDMAVADLSFRSIVKAASQIISLTGDRVLIALVKPQFEERGLISGFDGVIRSSQDLKTVLQETVRLLFDDRTFVLDIIESPIHGTKGNREFLCRIAADIPDSISEAALFERIISEIDKIC
ncbi:MAG: TlyA family RNA methyltransferase [Spirochaetia bacterium]|nr:TlyA family RNA methyltransferase [Spirochaetia bacterium]